MNNFVNAYTIVDSGCLIYGLISKKFAKKASLARIPLPHSKLVISIKGSSASVIEAVKVKIDIDGHVEKAWFYILGGDDEFDLILGRPWINKYNVRLAPIKKSLYISSSGIQVRSKENKKPYLRPKSIGALAMSA